MREILFRGKRIDDDTWVYGGIIRTFHPNFGSGITTQDVIDFYTQKENCYAICANNRDIFVWQHTIGQFTGLTDKNGKKIFDGDIVKTKFGRLCKVIFFTSDCFCGVDFVALNSDHKPPTSHDLYRSDNLEIVGNIYDNKDMVDGTNKS